MVERGCVMDLLRFQGDLYILQVSKNLTDYLQTLVSFQVHGELWVKGIKRKLGVGNWLKVMPKFVLCQRVTIIREGMFWFP